MTGEEVAVMLAEHGKEIGSLKHRVNDLEKVVDTIQELVLSVNTLALNMGNMTKEQERLGKAIEAMQAKPAKRWDTVITAIITSIIGGIIGLVIANVL